MKGVLLYNAPAINIKRQSSVTVAYVMSKKVLWNRVWCEKYNRYTIYLNKEEFVKQNRNFCFF